ncbi:MAG TPA: chromate efflux transporter, partial [Bdellovibrionota bacterium]|nr:chromate efflux transporter [Bdellovibrionota bacterium]
MKELVLAFSRFGWLGFGGPIATIAMMEEELQRRRGWVTEKQFAEIYAICKMLPGPVATQVAISLGLARAGRLGGLVAGLVYSFPKFLIILAFSVIYFRERIGLEYQELFAALQTAALVVILTSTMHLARPMGRDLKAIALAIVSAAVVWRFPLWEPLMILVAGLGGAIAAVRHDPGSGRTPTFALAPIPSPGVALGAIAAGAAAQPALLDLFWVCFKAGAFTFGTGLAVIPLLEADTVQLRSWLTHAEFMDGLAIGQVAPGPVVLSVTFIGYKVAGALGALVATLGVLVPPFINVLYIVP